MMAADEILSAFEKRTPTHYRHDNVSKPEPKPWWQCSPSLGGDLRKITNTNKETK